MFKHLKGISQSLTVINKSKFIGTACHVKNEEEAKAFVMEVTRKYSDATHNCYGYIADSLGNLLKFSDNGEPQGTAGMPILEVIRNKGLVETAVVVTRYFGGIKLGAGGLVRAYTEAAVSAINQGEIVVEEEGVFFTVEVDYNLLKPLELVIASLDSLENLGIDYADKVKISLIGKATDYENHSAKIYDSLNGKCEILEEMRDFYAFKAKE